MTLLLAMAIRSTVVLGLGLLATAVLARRSAALRHRVLAAALLGAALVWPASLVLPVWHIDLPAPVVRPPATSPLVVEPPAIAGGAAVPVAAPARSASSARAGVSPLVVVWLAGVLIAVVPLVAGTVAVRRMAARAGRVDDPRWHEVLRRVAVRYGLTRPVVLARTASPHVLATWGAWPPRVLLPAHAGQWPLDRVHVVLAHELAHIRRHDWLVQTIAEALRALLWFNPLAWMVCARLRRESEQACDDDVLGTGVGAREYATHLLDLARQCRRPGWAAALPMAHPSTLERRIADMLNPRIDRRTPSRRASVALGALLMLVVLPVAAVRARQAAPAPLSGTIYDVSGGVMPGVEVTLADANEVTWSVTSNASGRFEFPAVGPGTYVLQASVPGFRPLRNEFELRQAGDWSRVLTLQVGQLQETIKVRSTRVAAPKTPTGREPQRVRVGGNIRPPRKEVHVAPVYPQSMREAGLTGVVPVEAIIDKSGSVSSVRVLSAQIHPDFALAAADAVRQWRFTPTLLNGEPVEVVMTVTITFDLER